LSAVDPAVKPAAIAVAKAVWCGMSHAEVSIPKRLDEVATSVCLMGTSAPCDPVTPTVYANEDQRGFEVDSWSQPIAKRKSRLWLFI
jgi:hypothetical protein